jgi:hypothetical protein
VNHFGNYSNVFAPIFIYLFLGGHGTSLAFVREINTSLKRDVFDGIFTVDRTNSFAASQLPLQSYIEWGTFFQYFPTYSWDFVWIFCCVR